MPLLCSNFCPLALSNIQMTTLRHRLVYDTFFLYFIDLKVPPLSFSSLPPRSIHSLLRIIYCRGDSESFSPAAALRWPPASETPCRALLDLLGALILNQQPPCSWPHSLCSCLRCCSKGCMASGPNGASIALRKGYSRASSYTSSSPREASE